MRELVRGVRGRQGGFGGWRFWERGGSLFKAAGFNQVFELGEDAIAAFVGDFVVEGFGDSGDDLIDFFTGEECGGARGEIFGIFAFEEPGGCAPVAVFTRG